MVAAKIIAVAAARENLFVQAFPEFGVERRGAPVCAYVRISQDYIHERGRILNPRHLMILDPTLLEDPKRLTRDMKPNGWIVINSSQEPEAYAELLPGFRVATADANSIAIARKLGSRYAPFVNSAMLGAFARAVPYVSLSTLVDTVRDNSPMKPEENCAAAIQAYNETQLAAEVEAIWTAR